MQKVFIVTLFAAICAATKDLTGKAFIFPEMSNHQFVRLFTETTTYSELTSCLRYMTDQSTNHALISLAVPGGSPSFVVLGPGTPGSLSIKFKTETLEFRALTQPRNTWQSLCVTWSSSEKTVQVWLDGKPTIKKTTTVVAAITGVPEFILGQGHKDPSGMTTNERFVGMIRDVHTYDYVLSKHEVKRYTEDKNFTPGNVHNWKALLYQISGKVMLDVKS